MIEEKQFEDWQFRLKKEREELLEKTKKLLAFIDNPESEANYTEWEMLREQLRAMRDYLSILTRRCRYYKLIDVSEDLDAFYR
jgi:hypothetical protein